MTMVTNDTSALKKVNLKAANPVVAVILPRPLDLMIIVTGPVDLAVILRKLMDLIVIWPRPRAQNVILPQWIWSLFSRGRFDLIVIFAGTSRSDNYLALVLGPESYVAEISVTDRYLVEASGSDLYFGETRGSGPNSDYWLIDHYLINFLSLSRYEVEQRQKPTNMFY